MPKKHRHLANKCEDIVNLQGAYCILCRQIVKLQITLNLAKMNPWSLLVQHFYRPDVLPVPNQQCQQQRSFWGGWGLAPLKICRRGQSMF